MRFCFLILLFLTGSMMIKAENEKTEGSIYDLISDFILKLTNAVIGDSSKEVTDDDRSKKFKVKPEISTSKLSEDELKELNVENTLKAHNQDPKTAHFGDKVLSTIQNVDNIKKNTEEHAYMSEQKQISDTDAQIAVATEEQTNELQSVQIHKEIKQIDQHVSQIGNPILTKKNAEVVQQKKVDNTAETTTNKPTELFSNSHHIDKQNADDGNHKPSSNQGKKEVKEQETKSENKVEENFTTTSDTRVKIKIDRQDYEHDPDIQNKPVNSENRTTEIEGGDKDARTPLQNKPDPLVSPTKTQSVDSESNKTNLIQTDQKNKAVLQNPIKIQTEKPLFHQDELNVQENNNTTDGHVSKLVNEVLADGSSKNQSMQLKSEKIDERNIETSNVLINLDKDPVKLDSKGHSNQPDMSDSSKKVSMNQPIEYLKNPHEQQNTPVQPSSTLKLSVKQSPILQTIEKSSEAHGETKGEPDKLDPRSDL